MWKYSTPAVFFWRERASYLKLEKTALRMTSFESLKIEEKALLRVAARFTFRCQHSERNGKRRRGQQQQRVCIVCVATQTHNNNNRVVVCLYTGKGKAVTPIHSKLVKQQASKQQQQQQQQQQQSSQNYKQTRKQAIQCYNTTIPPFTFLPFPFSAFICFPVRTKNQTKLKKESEREFVVSSSSHISKKILTSPFRSFFEFCCCIFLSLFLKKKLLLPTPAWYYILRRFSSALGLSLKKDDVVVARTSVEQAKASDWQRSSRGVKTLSRTFWYYFAFTCLLTLFYLALVYSVVTGAHGEVNSFDPFEILGLQLDADSTAIKRAYRTLSLKYHPDKNPNNRAAEAKFMMVSKAYEALTDATAKENWQKYGNPDGKQSMAVFIGLPTFLLEPANRNLVLVAYLIAMVGVVPYCVYTYYSDSSKYGEKDVMYDTYAWFHHTLSEHTMLKSLPEIFAGAAEFRKRNMPTSIQEKQDIASLLTKVKSQMQKPKYNHPVCVKGNVLLHAHLLRQVVPFNNAATSASSSSSSLATTTDSADGSSSNSNTLETRLSEKDSDDLKYMLRVSTSLIDAMISVCKHQDSIQTAMNCIEFGQYMTQAMWVKDSPLLQLPHYTSEHVKHCTKKGIATVAQYRAQDESERRGMADFTAEQKQDVSRYLKDFYPDITVEAKVFVDDDEDDKVYEGDICTIQVTITRNHLANSDDRVGLVHAPRFPFPKREAFWVILGQIKEGKILSIEKVTNPMKKVVHKIRFMAPPKGHYEFDLMVKSNAYVGCDEKTRVSMETLDASTLPEYKVHPEDAELDDEPTLFEEMLNAHIEQDSDDEEDDDDDDDDDNDEKAKKKNIGKDDDDSDDDDDEDNNDTEAKKREKLRKARQQKDADSDSDDEEAEDVTPK
jgi:translocation protein SEC63